MIGRPCKPDNDLKGLWRTMFGTPFPACGVAEEGSEFARDGAREPGQASPNKSQPRAEADASGN